jgi:hypothetical protein
VGLIDLFEREVQRKRKRGERKHDGERGRVVILVLGFTAFLTKELITITTTASCGGFTVNARMIALLTY